MLTKTSGKKQPEITIEKKTAFASNIL